MIWISLVSLLLFVFVTFQVMKMLNFEKVLIIALFVKVIAGITLGLIYKYHYGEGDTLVYFDQAGTIANYLVDHPENTVSVFFGSKYIPELDARLVFAEQPRALFFSKILSLFYLGTGGNYWVISSWLSLLGFLGLYFLVFELRKKYPQAGRMIVASFFFLPTFVFWTSGILKESIAIGALGVSVGIALRIARLSRYSRVKYWLMFGASLWLLWKLKYFYAAALFPTLAILLLLDFTKNYPKYRIAFGFAAVLLLTLLVTNLHHNLHYSRILNIIHGNYLLGQDCSDCAVISYYQFDGSLISYLINLPLALFSGLFRPLLLEVNGALPILVAIENSCILIATLAALWRSGGRLRLKDPWVIGAIIFVIALASLISFSTPNFGTLSRYKVAYWPFFVLMILSLLNRTKKRPGIE